MELRPNTISLSMDASGFSPKLMDFGEDVPSNTLGRYPHSFREVIGVGLAPDEDVPWQRKSEAALA